MSSDHDEDGPIRPDSVSDVDQPEVLLGDRAARSPYPDEDQASSPYPDAGHSPYPDVQVGYPEGWGAAEPTAPTGRLRGHDATSGLALASQRTRDAYVPVQFDPATEFEPPEDLPPWYEDEYYDDRDWERLPRGTSTLFRVALFAGCLLIVGLIAGRYVKGWIDDQLDPPGGPGEEVTIEIPQLATTNDIVRILADEDIVANSTVFRYWLQYKDAGGFQAGEYTFNTNMAVWDVREILEAGPRIPESFSVTIPEGLTIQEIQATLLEALPEFDAGELADAIAAAPRPTVFPANLDLPTQEGFLFPATYDIGEDDTANEAALIGRMVAAFDSNAEEIGLGRSRRRVGLTPYQVLIVASLIEEEARVDIDRAKISRVLYNRLEAGDLLGVDATVIYATGDREITQSDLDSDSPYNTRKFAGLPPGPIAAPGRASLEAALSPERGDWYYYVLTEENGPGTHTFAVTAEEFEAAKAICRERDLGCG